MHSSKMLKFNYIILIIIIQKSHYTKLSSLHHGHPAVIQEGIIMSILYKNYNYIQSLKNERACTDIKTEKHRNKIVIMWYVPSHQN